MARKEPKQSVSSIWRSYFEKHPHLLDIPSNNEVYELFQKDHPDMELSLKLKQVCANVKSTMRNRKKKEGGSASTTSGVIRISAPVAAAAAVAPAPVVSASLEALELALDEALDMARQVAESEGISEVVLHLRRARSLVTDKLLA